MLDYNLIEREKELKDLIKKEISAGVKNKTKIDYQPNPLKTENQCELELKHACFKGLEEYVHRLEKGLTSLLEQNKLRLKEEERRGVEELIKRQNLEFSSGDLLQDKLHISDQTLLACYEFGSSLYQQRDFSKAADIFLFLTSLNPLLESLWIALAKAEECNHQDESAVLAYLMALELNHENIQSLYDSVKCLQRLHRSFEAGLLLDKYQEVLKDHPDREKILKQIADLKGGLK